MSETLNNQQGTPAARAAWKKHLGKWKLFAAAGGASMAASTDADAGIVYSGAINYAVTGGYNSGGTFGGGAKTFGLPAVRAGWRIVNGATKAAGFRSTAPIAITGGPTYFGFSGGRVINYAAGAPIHNSHFFPGQAPYYMMPLAMDGPAGQFVPPANGSLTGYAGFRSAGHLGWIKLKLTGDASRLPMTFTILSYAYNDVVGGAINAGQMPAAAVPEPGTMAMGLLASGAAGLVALRRAKARAAATGAEPAVA